MSTETPAGWYPAPDASDLLRFWDGEMWTERARPAPHSQAGPSTGATGNPSLSVQESFAVQRVLRSGERVEAGFSTLSVRRKHFVATGTRVIVLVPQGLLGRKHAEHSFEYDQIEAIGYSQFTGLNMTVGGVTFKGSSTSNVEDFISYVRNRLPRTGPADLAALPSPAAPASADTSPVATEPSALDDGDTTSLADELMKLAGLHTDGRLTDEEFSAAKARLIAE